MPCEPPQSLRRCRSFRQRSGSWPQITRGGASGDAADFSNAWIAALSPFGPDPTDMDMPHHSGLLHNPDCNRPQNARLDYIPMSFHDKTFTPHKWPRQLWFIETANVHGKGNLLIFTDGSIAETNDLLPK